jgi:hypothetical protein
MFNKFRERSPVKFAMSIESCVKSVFSRKVTPENIAAVSLLRKFVKYLPCEHGFGEDPDRHLIFDDFLLFLNGRSLASFIAMINDFLGCPGYVVNAVKILSHLTHWYVKEMTGYWTNLFANRFPQMIQLIDGSRGDHRIALAFVKVAKDIIDHYAKTKSKSKPESRQPQEKVTEEKVTEEKVPEFASTVFKEFFPRSVLQQFPNDYAKWKLLSGFISLGESLCKCDSSLPRECNESDRISSALLYVIQMAADHISSLKFDDRIAAIEFQMSCLRFLKTLLQYWLENEKDVSFLCRHLLNDKSILCDLLIKCLAVVWRRANDCTLVLNVIELLCRIGAKMGTVEIEGYYPRETHSLLLSCFSNLLGESETVQESKVALVTFIASTLASQPTFAFSFIGKDVLSLVRFVLERMVNPSDRAPNTRLFLAVSKLFASLFINLDSGSAVLTELCRDAALWRWIETIWATHNVRCSMKCSAKAHLLKAYTCRVLYEKDLGNDLWDGDGSHRPLLQELVRDAAQMIEEGKVRCLRSAIELLLSLYKYVQAGIRHGRSISKSHISAVLELFEKDLKVDCEDSVKWINAVFLLLELLVYHSDVEQAKPALNKKNNILTVLTKYSHPAIYKRATRMIQLLEPAVVGHELPQVKSVIDRVFEFVLKTKDVTGIQCLTEICRLTRECECWHFESDLFSLMRVISEAFSVEVIELLTVILTKDKARRHLKWSGLFELLAPENMPCKSDKESPLWPAYFRMYTSFRDEPDCIWGFICRNFHFVSFFLAEREGVNVFRTQWAIIELVLCVSRNISECLATNGPVFQALIGLLGDVLRNSVRFVREEADSGNVSFADNLKIARGCLQILNECAVPRNGNLVLFSADELMVSVMELLEFSYRRFREKKIGNEYCDLMVCCEMAGRLCCGESSDRGKNIAFREKAIVPLNGIMELCGERFRREERVKESLEWIGLLTGALCRDVQ